METDLIFKQRGWNDEAGKALRDIVDPARWLEFKAAIIEGHSTLWEVTGDGWRSWLVTYFESLNGGYIELRVEVLAGSHSRAIFAELKRRAKAQGVDSIAFETIHPEATISRLMGPLGFERKVSIFRASL
ncbi:hypothetical protein [Marinimicrobium sp. C2-29]|uniref:hypothetical protein n=1 Tax=Marinimicrobium sp. C2-29 TaxID=3139825 RepID=UPI003139557F